MRKYIAQLTIVCVLLSIVGCGRKWNNPVESAVPLPGVPGLISPANNAWIWNTQNTITFTWSKVDGATKYKLLLSNDSAITDSFVVIEIADTFYNWTDTNKLGKMYWQVKAWNPINVWKTSIISTFEKGPYIISKYDQLTGSVSDCVTFGFDYFYNSISNPSLDLEIYNCNNYDNITGNTYDYSRPADQIYYYNGYLLLPTANGLSIASLSNPAAPIEVSFCHITQGVNGGDRYLTINDTLAYLSSAWELVTGQGLKWAIRIVNIKDIMNPFEVSYIYMNDEPGEVAIIENYLYMVGHQNLLIFDISDPNNPSYVSSPIATDWGNIIIDGQNMYLANNSGTSKYNISNPINPSLSWHVGYLLKGKYNNYLLTANVYGRGFTIYDDTLNPPLLCGGFKESDTLVVNKLVVSNNYALCIGDQLRVVKIN